MLLTLAGQGLLCPFTKGGPQKIFLPSIFYTITDNIDPAPVIYGPVVWSRPDGIPVSGLLFLCPADHSLAVRSA